MIKLRYLYLLHRWLGIGLWAVCIALVLVWLSDAIS